MGVIGTRRRHLRIDGWQVWSRIYHARGLP